MRKEVKYYANKPNERGVYDRHVYIRTGKKPLFISNGTEFVHGSTLIYKDPQDWIITRWSYGNSDLFVEITKGKFKKEMRIINRILGI